MYASPAAATPIGIEITSGGTSRPVNQTTGATLNLFGDDFVLTAALFGSGGFFAPAPFYLPGATIAVFAGWSGIDAPGSYTYLGQTVTFGGFNGPGMTLNFLSDPFVVPPLDGSPTAEVPFTLTAKIQGSSTSEPLDLHGTGTMMFSFTGALLVPPPPKWGNGTAQFTIEQTPEPAAFITIAAALGGLGLMSRRRFRSWLITGETDETIGSD